MKWLCEEHNAHHGGSGETPLGLVRECLEAEASFHCQKGGLSTKDPKYAEKYSKYINDHFRRFSGHFQTFEDGKALGHKFEKYDLWVSFEAVGSGFNTTQPQTVST